MEKIIIKPNPNGDTRHAPKNVTFEQFREANKEHITDVGKVMNVLANKISEAGRNHDHTKIEYENLFFRDFLRTMIKGEDFTRGDFYKMHGDIERHHLNRAVPEDVNLIDVLEMISDCVCAGAARSGEMFELKLDNNLLEDAVNNTVKLVQSMIEIEEK